MLVTSRRKGEVLLIGEEIEITIVCAGCSRVRVGIRAPRQYPVVAGEDYGAGPAVRIDATPEDRR